MTKLTAIAIALIVSSLTSLAQGDYYVDIPITNLLAKANLTEQINADEILRTLYSERKYDIRIMSSSYTNSHGNYIELPLDPYVTSNSETWNSKGDFTKQYVCYLGKTALEGNTSRYDSFLYVLSCKQNEREISVIIPFWCSLKRYRDKNPYLWEYDVKHDRVLISGTTNKFANNH